MLSLFEWIFQLVLSTSLCSDFHQNLLILPGYNYNKLTSAKKIAVTPISPFRPRRWKGKILPSTKLIKIINLNTKKRPVSAVADNVEVRNIKNIKIKTNNSIKFKLLYDKNNSLTKKIKLEQARKQTV